MIYFNLCYYHEIQRNTSICIFNTRYVNLDHYWAINNHNETELFSNGLKTAIIYLLRLVCRGRTNFKTYLVRRLCNLSTVYRAYIISRARWANFNRTTKRPAKTKQHADAERAGSYHAGRIVGRRVAAAMLICMRRHARRRGAATLLTQGK